MKKGLKKQIEQELTDAINKTLLSHNTEAIAKTKKAVKSASKSVAKKFVKNVKAQEGKKSVTAEKKTKASPKAKPNKNVASKEVKFDKFTVLRKSNGRFSSVKNKVSLPGSLKKKIANPSRLAERN